MKPLVHSFLKQRPCRPAFVPTGRFKSYNFWGDFPSCRLSTRNPLQLFPLGKDFVRQRGERAGPLRTKALWCLWVRAPPACRAEVCAPVSTKWWPHVRLTRAGDDPDDTRAVSRVAEPGDGRPASQGSLSGGQSHPHKAQLEQDTMPTWRTTLSQGPDSTHSAAGNLLRSSACRAAFSQMATLASNLRSTPPPTLHSQRQRQPRLLFGKKI